MTIVINDSNKKPLYTLDTRDPKDHDIMSKIAHLFRQDGGKGIAEMLDATIHAAKSKEKA